LGPVSTPVTSTRQWTLDELERVPLPACWTWAIHDTGPCAVQRIRHFTGLFKVHEVKVVKGNLWTLLRFETESLGEWVVAPADVAFTVGLVSQGFDFYAAMITAGIVSPTQIREAKDLP
jgi:hypothetical protein